MRAALVLVLSLSRKPVMTARLLKWCKGAGVYPVLVLSADTDANDLSSTPALGY